MKETKIWRKKRKGDGRNKAMKETKEGRGELMNRGKEKLK